MRVTRRILDQLETELQRVENQLRGRGTGPIPSDVPATPGEGARVGDFHDQALASEAKEMAYETRDRLLKRLAALQEARRRLRDGSYGRCGDCDLPIPEGRLLAMPEATLCVHCQERRERALGTH